MSTLHSRALRCPVDLEEEFGRDVEAAAEAFDVVFVEFALAAQNLGDDAGRAEDACEVLLEEAVLVHEELEDFERLGAGKLVVAVFKILDKEAQCRPRFRSQCESPWGGIS